MKRLATPCRVGGCRREKFHSNGLCRSHGARHQRGRPLGDGFPPLPLCTVAGCERQRYGRGYCNPHWQRFRDHGDPLGGGVFRREVGEGNVCQDGYIRVRRNGRSRPEHVWVMEEHLGRPLFPSETVHHRNGQRADNRLENLELWSSAQPPGQRVADKVAWARELLATYEGALL